MVMDNHMWWTLNPWNTPWRTDERTCEPDRNTIEWVHTRMTLLQWLYLECSLITPKVVSLLAPFLLLLSTRSSIWIFFFRPSPSPLLPSLQLYCSPFSKKSLSHNHHHGKVVMSYVARNTCGGCPPLLQMKTQNKIK